MRRRKFCRFHRKTPVPESLFNKINGIIKKSLQQVLKRVFCSLEHAQHFEDIVINVGIYNILQDIAVVRITTADNEKQ